MQDLESTDVASEINILHSFIGHAPVGINKNFTMMACLAKYNSRTGLDSSSTELWNYLSSLYDLERLERLHGKLPFPNHEVDFDLSENEEFREMIEKRKLEASGKELSVKTEPIPEISDDNTLSGASTPVHVPAQAPVKERKRKSTQSSDVSVASSVERIGPVRRRDRSDSERTEKSETFKHRSRDKSDRHADEHIKIEKNESGSGKSTPSVPSSSSSGRGEVSNSAAKRNRGSFGGKRSRSSMGRETPTLSSSSSSSKPSSSSSAAASSAKKHRNRREVE